MVPTRLCLGIGVVLLAAITIAPALGWALTRAGRLDRPPSASMPTPTPAAATADASLLVV